MIRSASHSSYPRIGDSPWDQELRLIAREREAGLADDAAVQIVEDEVAAMMVAEQSRAFVDVVTDGQVRWSGPFSHVASQLDGRAPRRPDALVRDRSLRPPARGRRADSSARRRSSCATRSSRSTSGRRR